MINCANISILDESVCILNDWKMFPQIFFPFQADVQQLEVKAEQAPAPSKKEASSVAETKVLDGVNPTAVTGKKKNSAKKQKTEHGKNDQNNLTIWVRCQLL